MFSNRENEFFGHGQMDFAAADAPFHPPGTNNVPDAWYVTSCQNPGPPLDDQLGFVQDSQNIHYEQNSAPVPGRQNTKRARKLPSIGTIFANSSRHNVPDPTSTSGIGPNARTPWAPSSNSSGFMGHAPNQDPTAPLSSEQLRMALDAQDPWKNGSFDFMGNVPDQNVPDQLNPGGPTWDTPYADQFQPAEWNGHDTMAHDGQLAPNGDVAHYGNTEASNTELYDLNSERNSWKMTHYDSAEASNPGHLPPDVQAPHYESPVPSNDAHPGQLAHNSDAGAPPETFDRLTQEPSSWDTVQYEDASMESHYDVPTDFMDTVSPSAAEVPSNSMRHESDPQPSSTTHYEEPVDIRYESSPGQLAANVGAPAYSNPALSTTGRYNSNTGRLVPNSDAGEFAGHPAGTWDTEPPTSYYENSDRSTTTRGLGMKKPRRGLNSGAGAFADPQPSSLDMVPPAHHDNRRASTTVQYEMVRGRDTAKPRQSASNSNVGAPRYGNPVSSNGARRGSHPGQMTLDSGTWHEAPPQTHYDNRRALKTVRYDSNPGKRASNSKVRAFADPMPRTFDMVPQIHYKNKRALTTVQYETVGRHDITNPGQSASNSNAGAPRYGNSAAVRYDSNPEQRASNSKVRAFADPSPAHYDSSASSTTVQYKTNRGSRITNPGQLASNSKVRAFVDPSPAQYDDPDASVTEPYDSHPPRSSWNTVSPTHHDNPAVQYASKQGSGITNPGRHHGNLIEYDSNPKRRLVLNSDAGAPPETFDPLTHEPNSWDASMDYESGPSHYETDFMDTVPPTDSEVPSDFVDSEASQDPTASAMPSLNTAVPNTGRRHAIMRICTNCSETDSVRWFGMRSKLLCAPCHRHQKRYKKPRVVTGEFDLVVSRKCSNCLTTDTYQWHNVTSKNGILCNACKQYQNAHNKPRPSKSTGEHVKICSDCSKSKSTRWYKNHEKSGIMCGSCYNRQRKKEMELLADVVDG